MSTEHVSNFVKNLKYENIPEIVIIKAKTAIRDIIGVSIAAYHDEAVKTARKMAMARGRKKEANILGSSIKVPCEMAAFVNAVMASTLDMDDGSMGLRGHLRVHRGHPGGIIVPSAMASAQPQHATGKQLLEAIIAGYEVTLMTAWMIGQTVLASVTGCYGAAAAAAKLLNLSCEKITQTFNIVSAHCPQPSYAFIWTKIDMSKESAAWSALTAIMATYLSDNGFRATPGFYECPEHDENPFKSLGKDWEMLDLYFKQYSACRHAHAPIDAVLKLKDDHNIDPKTITNIVVGCAAKKGCNMNNRRPNNIWQAQYSIPFVIGAALTSGKVGPNQVNNEMLKDKAILKISDKVDLVVDEDVENLQPGTFASRVKIKISDGRQYETFIEHPKGDPENPFSEKELKIKYNELTFPIIGEKKASQISSCIDNLEECRDINDLFQMIMV
jgi:2-methylcitrate dehydratase PrpD